MREAAAFRCFPRNWPALARCVYRKPKSACSGGEVRQGPSGLGHLIPELKQFAVDTGRSGRCSWAWPRQAPCGTKRSTDGGVQRSLPQAGFSTWVARPKQTGLTSTERTWSIKVTWFWQPTNADQVSGTHRSLTARAS